MKCLGLGKPEEWIEDCKILKFKWRPGDGTKLWKWNNVKHGHFNGGDNSGQLTMLSSYRVHERVKLTKNCVVVPLETLFFIKSCLSKHIHGTEYQSVSHGGTSTPPPCKSVIKKQNTMFDHETQNEIISLRETFTIPIAGFQEQAKISEQLLLLFGETKYPRATLAANKNLI